MGQPVFDLSDYAGAVFAYGSLLSVASLEQTLGRRFDRPVVTCRLEGWRRSWDAAMPNPGFYADAPSGRLVPGRIIYLNVRPTPGSLLNGTLLALEAEELVAMDKREWIYDREVINTRRRGVTVVGGEAYVYVARPAFLLSEVPSATVAAVRASYLEILDAGLSQFGLVLQSRV